MSISTVDISYEGRLHSMQRTIRDLSEECDALRQMTADLPGLYDEIAARESDIELLSDQAAQRARKIALLLDQSDRLLDALEGISSAGGLEEAVSLAVDALRA